MLTEGLDFTVEAVSCDLPRYHRQGHMSHWSQQLRKHGLTGLILHLSSAQT